MDRTTLIPQLLSIFRQYGYEGASLTKISEKTGLGKASLYHHFPKGKEEMAQAVMSYLNDIRQKNILEPLNECTSPESKLSQMVESMMQTYDEGRVLCMLSILTVSESRQQFLPLVQPAFLQLIEAITVVLVEAKIPLSIARERAEDAVSSIQGALILSHALEENQPFLRVMSQLTGKLLAPVLMP